MLLQDFYLSALSLASHWLSVPSLAGSGSPSTTSTLNTARSILSSHPLLDLHIDLPVVARFAYGNNISSFPYDSGLPAHVDLPRLRKGKSGGFFSIAFVPCPSEIEGSGEEGEDFNGPTNTVRDTLEQIDVTHNLEEWFHEQGVALARSTDDVYSNFKHGKISHIIGVEGAHMLGNSLAVMRQYASLGARYLTLTHTCHNAFGDSCTPSEPLHSGLSTFGHDLISELNRLGVLVDVSHTSNSTASDAILASRAPVIFSHSSSKALFDHPRNVEDSVLRLFSEPNPNWKGHGRGTERGAAWKERDGLVAATAVPAFIGLNGTVEDVADHIEHLASVVGKHRVGLGTDFDGYREDPPKGLEDVSMYPKLLATLLQRGWSRRELAGLIGGNFLRVWSKVEAVRDEMKREGVLPSMAVYEKRPDLGHGKTWKQRPQQVQA